MLLSYWQFYNISQNKSWQTYPGPVLLPGGRNLFIIIGKVPFGVHTINRNKPRLKTTSCKSTLMIVLQQPFSSRWTLIWTNQFEYNLNEIPCPPKPVS